MRRSVHEEIFAVLSGIEALTGVFDGQAPDGQPGPYAVIGQTQELQGRLLNDSERKLYTDIHIWSSYQGKAEILAILDAIESAMPENYLFEDCQVIKDDASGWQHGVLTWRVYFERS